MSDHYDITHHRALVEHRCGECRATIPKGAMYARHTSITSDGVATHRMCLDCDAWADALVKASRAAGQSSDWYDEDATWIWGSLWEAIGEFAREVLSDEAVAYREQEMARRAGRMLVVWGGGPMTPPASLRPVSIR